MVKHFENFYDPFGRYPRDFLRDGESQLPIHQFFRNKGFTLPGDRATN
jgi:hypothetical protein